MIEIYNFEKELTIYSSKLEYTGNPENPDVRLSYDIGFCEECREDYHIIVYYAVIDAQTGELLLTARTR